LHASYIAWIVWFNANWAALSEILAKAPSVLLWKALQFSWKPDRSTLIFIMYVPPVRCSGPWRWKTEPKAAVTQHTIRSRIIFAYGCKLYTQWVFWVGLNFDRDVRLDSLVPVSAYVVLAL
jgi:hypothetical protein